MSAQCPPGTINAVEQHRVIDGDAVSARLKPGEGFTCNGQIFYRSKGGGHDRGQSRGPGRLDEKGLEMSAQGKWRVVRRVLAWLRWSKTAVCEESVGRGLYDDFHDYPDSTTPEPWHFVEHICARCGKRFCI